MAESMRSKADRPTVRRRVDELLLLLLRGKNSGELRQYVSAWGISERQFYRYLSAAYDAYGEADDKERRKLIGKHRIRREAMYEQAMEAGEIGTALNVLKDLAELENSYPAKTVNSNSIHSFPDPAQMKAEILKRIQGHGANNQPQ